MPDSFSITSPILTGECVSARNCCDDKPVCLPSYLNNTDPLEPEDIPLQLALVTMELAAMRTAQARLARALRDLADAIEPRGWSYGEGPS